MRVLTEQLRKKEEEAQKQENKLNELMAANAKLEREIVLHEKAAEDVRSAVKTLSTEIQQHNSRIEQLKVDIEKKNVSNETVRYEISQSLTQLRSLIVRSKITSKYKEGKEGEKQREEEDAADEKAFIKVADKNKIKKKIEEKKIATFLAMIASSFMKSSTDPLDSLSTLLDSILGILASE